MNYYTFFSKQARKPEGLFGRFYMKRIFEKGNHELNTHVFKNLSLKNNDRILEIGFGPGTLLKDIGDCLDTGFIEGVDFSKAMVGLAKKKNRKHIKSGKVKLIQGDFNSTVFQPNSFDKIFTVNTLYFWSDPAQTTEKIYRALKLNGKVIIGYHAKEEMENSPLNQDIFKYYSKEDVEKLLSAHNFKEIQTLSTTKSGKPCYCCMGSK
jgi:ubiquinone/menaquinone biosynthesis C-methylase UbiE